MNSDVNEMEKNDDLKEKDGYKKTGLGQDSKGKLSTLALLYSTILGVLGGIISSLIPFSLLIKVWYPLTGGTQLVSGHHVIWAAIVYGLTRDKKTVMITMTTKGLLEFLLGDLWGLLIILVNVMEGLCLVIGFILVEKLGEGNTKIGWGVAGGIGNFFQAPFFWIINQRWYLHWILWALAFIFAFISGIFITGVLGKIAKDYLIKAGVPTTF